MNKNFIIILAGFLLFNNITIFYKRDCQKKTFFLYFGGIKEEFLTQGEKN